jgi:hypothetical protein
MPISAGFSCAQAGTEPMIRAAPNVAASFRIFRLPRGSGPGHAPRPARLSAREETVEGVEQPLAPEHDSI